MCIDSGIESRFLMLLPSDEKAAQSKIRFFEEKYSIRLSELEELGLPDDAGYDMHEDYIMWHHWSDVFENVGKSIY
jgi:hypothetical protein